MQQDVVGAVLRRPVNQGSVGLVRCRTPDIRRQPDGVDPEHVLVVPVGRTQLDAQERRERLVAGGRGVRDRPTPPSLEVVGQHQEVVARSAVLGDDLLGWRHAVRAVRVRVQIAAEPPACGGEGGRAHRPAVYPRRPIIRSATDWNEALRLRRRGSSACERSATSGGAQRPSPAFRRSSICAIRRL
jgi:hypothetical protein